MAGLFMMLPCRSSGCSSTPWVLPDIMESSVTWESNQDEQNSFG